MLPPLLCLSVESRHALRLSSADRRIDGFFSNLLVLKIFHWWASGVRGGRDDVDSSGCSLGFRHQTVVIFVDMQ